MRDEDVRIIKETFLSKMPRPRSAWVALTTVAVSFLLSFLCWRNVWGMSESLPAIAGKVRVEHEYWRLLTSMGVHTDLGHLLSNVGPLGLLAYLLYGYYGPLVHPALMLPLGAVVTWLALATYLPHTSLLGASGLIYMMAGFWLTLYLFIERRYTWGKRFFRALGFALLVLAPTAYHPDVSYRAHAIGFLFGTALGVTYFVLKRQTLRRAEVFEIENDWAD